MATTQPLAPPRPVGLLRRQSYDPLSSQPNRAKHSLAKDLSLGKLPSPSFANVPAGQRSVPALNLDRRLGLGARAVGGNGAGLSFADMLGPRPEGQRTPGGSLVIGSEIFGFGGPSSGKKDGRARWGTGNVEEEDRDESPPARLSLDEDPLDDGLNWPTTATTFASSLNTPTHQVAGFSLDDHSSARGAFLNGPSLTQTHSSADLRSPPTLDTPQLGRSSLELASPDSDLLAHQPNLPTAANFVPPGPSPSSIDANADLYSAGLGYVADATNDSRGYFPPTSGAFGLARTPLGPPPRSPGYPFDSREGSMHNDELAFSMRSMGLNDSADSAYRQSARNLPGPGAGSGSAYARPEPQPPLSRQSSTPFGVGPQFNNYIPPGGSPYVPNQELYSSAPYQDPSFFGGSADKPSIAQRDSAYGLSSGTGTPSPYGSYPPGGAAALSPALAPQWAGMPPAAAYARPSYSPFSAYGMSPSQSYGVDHGPSHYPTQHMNGRGGGRPHNHRGHGHGHGHGHHGDFGHGGHRNHHGGPDNNNSGGGGRTARSAILEDFRASRQRDWELVHLKGHVVEFAGDQLGSRHIQTKLETASAEEISGVFDELLPSLLQLSTDVFANYTIQKLFELGSTAQRSAMAHVLEGHVLPLSLQMYGCRVVQKALEHVTLEEQVKLVNELDGHVLRCARDAQSNHVVQRAIERVPSDKLKFITEACTGQIHSLATHAYGCRVIQRIFEHFPIDQSRPLLDELHRYTQTLIEDQFGNYVLQWIITDGPAQDRALVISKIQGQFLALAQQKFASNVVEKAVVHATDDERKRMIDEVLAPAEDGSNVVKSLLVHPFGNYPFQKLLHVAMSPQREELFVQTQAQLTQLRKFSNNYSKHLVTIEKVLASERARTGTY